MSSGAENKTLKFMIMSGSLLIVAALALLIWNFWPAIQMEISYQINSWSNNQDNSFGKIAGLSTDNLNLPNDELRLRLTEAYKPLSTDFGIVIPKIQANAKIVANVDPYEMSVYSKALENGIAHALGSALPGVNGNTFMFAHSGRNFYDSRGQNVQFYLLDKLTVGDKIMVFYSGKIYLYSVFNLNKVEPDDISYLQDQSQPQNILTLMSCWPAGVNYKRQIVQANLLQVI
jgi:LPXTG-site transpeptidase (sortase) family protein